MINILVVEDNIKILKSICDELDNHFDTYKCSDGEEALYQIKQNIYDLIILDLMLPGINGLDILKNIRRNIETPVLILTAKEELDDKVKAFENNNITSMAKASINKAITKLVTIVLSNPIDTLKNP